MYLVPELEDVDYLMNPGRKDLSQRHIDKLDRQLANLKKVSGDEKAMALFQMGLINAYLNRFEESAQSYFDSYHLDSNDVVYTNYLISLGFNQNPERSIQEGLSFLERNPNNYEILGFILTKLMKYVSSDYLERTKDYLKYHASNEKIYSILECFYNHCFQIQQQLLTRGISINVFNKLVNLAEIEVFKILNIAPVTELDSIEDDCYFYNIALEFDSEEILNIDRNYHSAVKKALQNNEISFEDHIDSMSKLVISFIEKQNVEKVA